MGVRHRFVPVTHQEVVSAISGLALGLSIVVVVGAQNAFVLRQALKGEHMPAVLLFCIVSDMALITAGVEIAGAVQSRLPWLSYVFRFGGAAFLIGYGVLAARRAVRPAAMTAASDGSSRLSTTLAACFALTWLNPHVYVDTVVLLGSVAVSENGYRWWFAGGAMAASTIWFLALGFGAKLLRPLFARALAWRVLDSAVAAMVTVVAVSLAIR